MSPLMFVTPLAEILWDHFLTNILSAVVFGILGILLMVLGYKAFDWITPNLDVQKELAENHNIAVAIVIAAVLIGVSLLIAHIVSA
jgi:putative membrane protein